MPDQPSDTADEPSTTVSADDPEAGAEHDGHVRAEIEDTSNDLLAAVDEIRRLEVDKRHVRMSTPEFHAAANAIERKSRAVFGLARSQREVGEQLTKQQAESIDDQAAEEQAAEEPSDR